MTSVWPLEEMEFMRCPSVKEYLARMDPRERKVGPVIFCSQNVNLDYNFCVQKHMNILPAKKNSSWKDACKNLRQMFEKCPRILSECLTEKEYKHFVDEFLVDIRATVIAMEEVCPIAKKSSLGLYTLARSCLKAEVRNQNQINVKVKSSRNKYQLFKFQNKL